MAKPEDHARAVSRSDRGQIVAQFAICGADPCWNDSAVRYGSGLQQRCGDSPDFDTSVCDGDFARFQAECLWEAEHICTDCCSNCGTLSEAVCVDAARDVSRYSGALDCRIGAAFCGAVCLDCSAKDELAAGADGSLIVGGTLGEGSFFLDGDVAVLGGIEDFSALLTLDEFGVILAGDDFDNGMFADGGHLGSENVNGMDFARLQTPCQPGFPDFMLSSRP
jgi:hypothetical protein